MNKTEYNRLIKDISKVTNFLHLEEHDPDKQKQPKYCYAIKVNFSCVADADDLWYNWLDFWSIDSFIKNCSHQHNQITQVTLRIFDPSELTDLNSLEGPQHCHIIYDIRSRLSGGYLCGLKKWPYG